MLVLRGPSKPVAARPRFYLLANPGLNIPPTNVESSTSHPAFYATSQHEPDESYRRVYPTLNNVSALSTKTCLTSECVFHYVICTISLEDVRRNSIRPIQAPHCSSSSYFFVMVRYLSANVAQSVNHCLGKATAFHHIGVVVHERV